MSVKVFISGQVQGVGFRQFIKQFARKLKITGWVRNLKDGRVEAFFQGEEKDVKKLIRACCKGPFLAHVKDVQVIEENLQKQGESYTDFIVC